MAATFWLLCLALPVSVLGETVSTHIVGGVEAVEGGWPWMMSLTYLGTQSCGASLLGSRYAATAAHCVGGSALTYHLYFGNNNRSCEGDDCVDRGVTGIQRYPTYEDNGLSGYPNDLAVITWTTPVLQHPGSVEFISLATTADDALGQTCYITGWGRLQAIGLVQTMLYQAEVNMLTTADCAARWAPTPINDTQVCAFDSVNQSVAACNGDTGGPLVCQPTFNAPWKLVGIMSWGQSNCSPSYPTVCTRVSSYRDWILAQQP